MEKEKIIDLLEDFKKIIVTDGGDYEILEISDNYIKLKIKGRKNSKRSRENLFSLIKYTVHKKYPKEKIKFEIEHWIVPTEHPIVIKLKKWFKINNNKE
ncbi:MAG: hypothetical protein PHQ32_05060 [Firmicutes bacterium]|nr:hypothetical protein [Bacillota bacterium]